MSLCLTAVAKRVACTFFKSSLFLATPLTPLCCLTTLLRTSRSLRRKSTLRRPRRNGVARCRDMPSLIVPTNDHDARSMLPHSRRLSSTSGVVSRRQSNSFTRVAPSHPRRPIAARTSCAGTDVKTSSRNTCPGDARKSGRCSTNSKTSRSRVRVNKENEGKSSKAIR